MAHPSIVILHQDDQIVVIDKPAGLLCVPERGGRGETVLSLLADVIEQSSGEPLRLVHRIDRDTSGVLLLARTPDSQRALTQQFMDRTVAKTYLALVRGSPDESAGRVDVSVGEMRGNLVRVCVNPKRGKPAVTNWEVLERFVGYTLLRCRPLTGRQHQIRLHMRVAGMPLAVDDLYGGSSGVLLSSFKHDYKLGRGGEERPLIARLTLHAESIEFDRPATGERMRFEAPLPKDFRATLNQLRKHAAIGPPPRSG
jgi:RluA family pseudouridine synthase